MVKVTSKMLDPPNNCRHDAQRWHSLKSYPCRAGSGAPSPGKVRREVRFRSVAHLLSPFRSAARTHRSSAFTGRGCSHMTPGRTLSPSTPSATVLGAQSLQGRPGAAGLLDRRAPGPWEGDDLRKPGDSPERKQKEKKKSLCVCGMQRFLTLLP